jgi:SP family myo-inositol transporter-like MFS transporter 13
MPAMRFTPATYGKFLILIAGFGGLLYGIDIGVIAAALLYLSKTVDLNIAQTSAIVAAVLGGSMISSLVTGLLADLLGRRKIMIASGLMFLSSVALIVLSQSFTTLILGRLLQGMSGGVIAVVIPLYLAECLGAKVRGRGTAIFQLLLTVGVVAASFTGLLYTRSAEASIAAANGNAIFIRAAENHAWRSMFLITIYPGLLFFLGTLLLVESPRWLFRKGRTAEALRSLHQLLPPAEAERQFLELEQLAAEQQPKTASHPGDSLLQRKYIVPFVLACLVLACNQATGINSILGFLVVILKQAGMNSVQATQGNFIVEIMHCLMTIVAVLLVDRKGRRFLLRIGTAGLIVSLLGGAFLFHTFEAKRVNVKPTVLSAVQDNTLHLPLNASTFGLDGTSRSMALTVLYSYGHGDKVAVAFNTDHDPTLALAPDRTDPAAPLTIRSAFYGPVASPGTGWLITLCLGMFVSFFSLGPGVVVWLMLSELMPTRIRSTGMGIALFINQGVSTSISAVFLTVVGRHGYYAMFAFWAGCATIYFIIATFFLPETKGRTLEEIEEYFERAPPAAVAQS